MTTGRTLPLNPLPLGYRRRQGGLAALYDEFIEADDSVRPHWKQIRSYLERLGPEEIQRRWNQARKILRDNGVAYNAGSSDAQSAFRTWELNPIPLRIPEEEWKSIEAAVRQRGRLMNSILNDLYGSQTLLKEGLIPPALILGNGTYLRPCVGVPVPQDARLVLYAVDLARSPDGTWWVLSDRTQAPSGAGYALENRVVLSRVFPEIFQRARIARLGGFFQKMKESLEALSPRPGLPPNVVLLTPGQLNETHFEHAYLARQLDFTLVEGQDLTVRNDMVYIRTLQGLQRVDVILRRVDDDYCDPLELRDESLLGVPGLLNAVRAGTVTLANSLGSGLVQCPALGAFLPKLSERLLGEKLLMPSVATWWCGQPAEQKYVLDNLHGLVAQPAFEFPGTQPIHKTDREPIRAAIRSNPELYAAQEFVRLSQCPDFNNGTLAPRSVVLRVFAVRTADGYVVMPGGLTRVAIDELSQGALITKGGGTKDTWVDAPDLPPPAAPTPGLPGTELRRTLPGLTSRLADSLFWLGRYAERAEFTTRMVRAVLEGMSNQAEWLDLADVLPVLRTLKGYGQWTPPAVEDRASLEKALTLQMRDRALRGSLVSVVSNLREALTSVRDQVTADTWLIVNQLADGLLGGPDQPSRPELDLNKVMLYLSALNGVLGENMTHGSGWLFVGLGRRMERAIYSARLVAESLTGKEPGGVTQFEILLEVFDAVITYRQKYTTLQRESVLDLLLCDESNPRSLASQLVEVQNHLLGLPRESTSGFKLSEERLALRVLSDVRLLDVSRLEVEMLHNVEEAMMELSGLITQRYFMHMRTASVGRDVAMPNLPESV